MRQMPGNRLALAVRVSRQDDRLGILSFLTDAFEHLAATPDRNILRFKVVFNVYAQLGLGQIADMAVGGLHLIRSAQEFGNRARLGGRLHDHQLMRRLTACQLKIPPWAGKNTGFISIRAHIRRRIWFHVQEGYQPFLNLSRHEDGFSAKIPSLYCFGFAKCISSVMPACMPARAAKR